MTSDKATTTKCVILDTDKPLPRGIGGLLSFLFRSAKRTIIVIVSESSMNCVSSISSVFSELFQQNSTLVLCLFEVVPGDFDVVLGGSVRCYMFLGWFKCKFQSYSGGCSVSFWSLSTLHQVVLKWFEVVLLVFESHSQGGSRASLVVVLWRFLGYSDCCSRASKWLWDGFGVVRGSSWQVLGDFRWFNVVLGLFW